MRLSSGSCGGASSRPVIEKITLAPLCDGLDLPCFDHSKQMLVDFLQQSHSLVSSLNSSCKLSWLSDVAVKVGRQLVFSKPQIRIMTSISRNIPKDAPSLINPKPGRTIEPCRESPKLTRKQARSLKLCYDSYQPVSSRNVSAFIFIDGITR